jgi:hypothetical protein
LATSVLFSALFSVLTSEKNKLLVEKKQLEVAAGREYFINH